MTGEAKYIIRRYISELRMSTHPEDVEIARMLDRLLANIDRELNVAADFPAEAISKIFYKVDATFHSIFMRSTIGLISNDYTYKMVSTDIENSLREITKATGGTLMTTNNLIQAIDKIGEIENVYYLLTYAPDAPDRVGKIKIKVADKKYKVVYDDNIRADYIKTYLANQKTVQPQPADSAIQITDLKFADKKLSISVGGFFMRQISPKDQSGKMDVRIRVNNIIGANIFDQRKILDIKKPDITITLPFEDLEKGEYNIVVFVKDLLTNKIDTKLIQPHIN